jgi:glutamate synthase domain-containing protein 2/glutamate synthase domain-containing protein 1/glutamate synthase domain-containing protein 3
MRMKDACGVGVVADIKGRSSHEIVRQGIQVLVNLDHRGARGADPDTADGSGILIQLPDAHLRSRCKDADIILPSPGSFGVGMTFLPRNQKIRAQCMEHIEGIVIAEGQEFIGWREVPVDSKAVGPVARSRQPVIKQFFVGQDEAYPNNAAFERQLYIIRKSIEQTINTLNARTDEFYICSLSARLIVYKGMIACEELAAFYEDLRDKELVSAFAMVHSRFSTNTLGEWKLAHPYRHVVHNGEINTLRGNINWMHAREAMFSSPEFGDELKKLFPIITPDASDTAGFDNALELLLQTGRSLPHSLMMMMPEAWERHAEMPQERRDFYEYHAALMEPWDGPALIAASDGNRIAAILDRNGLRPFRYTVTKENLLIMGSETGVLDIPSNQVAYKGRLSPGRMFLVDPSEGRIVGDHELKTELARRRPYGKWLQENKMDLQDLPNTKSFYPGAPDTLHERQLAFGYSAEDLNLLIGPMAAAGREPVGSMGNDTPLAALSERSPLLFHYFKQLFAQVSNPPIDAIREELVTASETYIGSEQNLFAETPLHCRQLRIPQPILTNKEMEQIHQLDEPGFKTRTLSIVFERAQNNWDLQRAMDRLCAAASEAVKDGCTILILSDRDIDASHVPIPSLLAVSGVHHHLIRTGERMRVGIALESGEPREVHHFAVLLGYGAGAINPYLALETVEQLCHEGPLDGISIEDAKTNYIKAAQKGVVKAMSKMGISTFQSYRGGQIFEAVGLDLGLIEQYFTWTPSRLSGIGLEVLAQEAVDRHSRGYPERRLGLSQILPMGGQYQWVRGEEEHKYSPDAIAMLQNAARDRDMDLYRKFADLNDSEEGNLSTIRGLLNLRTSRTPVPLDEIEPATEIVKRFSTGAISLGAISKETHETLAIAMNRIAGRSNSGEGGEDYRRYKPDANGENRSSAIKQVASGRFGVTTNYLVNATDLQIKMAQGAKPGEGGQLPGWKVEEYIGWIRHTTPGVELISPPPHHDIYSIEDLAQLIHDLKNVNPAARIHVKLVAEVGVGTIAAGVAKGHGDVVLISGGSGGTGASPLSSIKHAGIPWELGLAETHRVLVENDLRGRIVVQTDGQLKTGRDVAIACLLGAEEFGFATGPLVTLGCIMLRNCHLNTCSVGIATQDPELRKRFDGTPEAVINYFFMIAEHLRELMSKLGLRTINEMVGRVDLLNADSAIEHWKAAGLDLSYFVEPVNAPQEFARHNLQEQDHGLTSALDQQLIKMADSALTNQSPVEIDLPIRNSNRTVGAMLSGKIAKLYGEEGLPANTIQCRFSGSTGQSFGAFLANGINMRVEGDANDYLGKGMSGGRIVLVPPADATFIPEENVIAGNVILYGATGGKVFIRGQVGERFCVRNSGAQAVVEGIADHGCEYMTGGVVVIIGPTGRNFAAGMSGGIAYIWDYDSTFASKCNLEMVDLEKISDSTDAHMIKALLKEHYDLTGSTIAASIIDDWKAHLPKFTKVLPRDYKRIMNERASRSAEEEERAMELIHNG